jgi:hypothetical protein
MSSGKSTTLATSSERTALDEPLQTLDRGVRSSPWHRGGIRHPESPRPARRQLPLMGYVRGGVTVLGTKKAYPVYVDETIELFEVVSVSAGMRGLQVLLSGADYVKATEATVGAIAELK